MLVVYFQACKIALILLLDPSLLKWFLVLCCVGYHSHVPQQKYAKRSSAAFPCPLIKLIPSISSYKEPLGGQGIETQKARVTGRRYQRPLGMCSGLKVLQQQQ